MSLDWDISKCKDVEAIKAEGMEWFKTEAMIWGTMVVGIYHVTEKTAPDFYARLKVVEKINGAFVRDSKANGHKEVFLTFEDVQKRIGMHSNASTETKTHFLKRMTTLEKATSKGVSINEINAIYSSALVEVEKINA